MRQVLIRARNLLRRPAAGLSAGLVALGGSALVFLPLFGVPGLELGLALSIGVGVLGGGLGVASVHQERRLLAGQAASPEPTAGIPEGASARLAWKALAPALLLSLAVLVPPLLAATLYAWLGTKCDPFALVAFYPLLTVPSAGRGQGLLALPRHRPVVAVRHRVAHRLRAPGLRLQRLPGPHAGAAL